MSYSSKECGRFFLHPADKIQHGDACGSILFFIYQSSGLPEGSHIPVTHNQVFVKSLADVFDDVNAN